MTSDNETRVMRTVAWRLVPFLSIGYLINALDRFNVSIAALTMNKALGLSASAYGLAAGAFFWSYVLFQIPANLILQRIGARVWLTVIMVVWGLCSAGTAFVTNETTFVIARFLLGVAEAGFFPGVTYFMTCWFPARYRGQAMGWFFAAAAFAGVVGAPLSANLLKLDEWLGVQGWQWIFLIEGVPAVVLALFGPFVLRNRPADASWLAPEDRAWLQQRLDAEATVKTGHGWGMLSSIANTQVVLLTIVYLLMAYGVYSLAFFLPLIIKTMGVSNTTIGYLAALPNLFGSVGMVLFSRSSDRTGERVWHVVIPVTLAGLGSLAAGVLLGSPLLTMVALCVGGFGIASSLPVFWNLPTAYLGAASAAGGIAFINMIGNVSGYVAPQVTGLLRDASGGYELPLLVTGVLVLFAAALILVSGIRRHVARTVHAATPGIMLH